MHRTDPFFPLTPPASRALVLGLVVSFALFVWMSHQQQNSQYANFKHSAQSRAMDLQQGITNAVDALQFVNQLFVTNGNVGKQFHAFTQPMHARYPYIAAFAFYQGRMLNGKGVVAAGKDRYRVIDSLEPTIGNEPAFGLDASFMPSLDDAVLRAKVTGLPSATGLFPALKEAGSPRGFGILMAVYKRGAALDDVASRRLAAVGSTLAVLRAGDFVETILSSGSLGKMDLNIRVYAAASADESKLVYGQTSTATRNREWQPAWFFSDRSEPFSFSRSLDVAGTTWHIVVSAPSQPFAASHDGATLALIMGLLTTFAATAYLQAVAMRAQRIAQLVALRTDELKQVNDLLIEDIKARKQVEQALVSNEERSRQLADLSSDWSWEQDEHFRFTAISTNFATLYTKLMGENAPPPPDILGTTRWELPVDLNASDWPAHRALLEAHQAFKDFEYKALVNGIPPQWISTSGEPLFDALGYFKGYLGTSRIISDRKQAEEALHRSRSELRNLANYQQGIREDERKRIARDVHDGLGQDLISLRIKVSMMAVLLESAAVTKSGLDAALEHIDTIIDAVRVIINDLRPAALDIGLHAAVEWQLMDFERRTGIVCELNIDHEEFALDDTRATALFRIVQESLTNIIKHAQANRVQIKMQRKSNTLVMTITDDGIGFSSDFRKKANAFGLIGIEERIHTLTGTFSIISNPGQGARMMLTIPI